MICLILPAVIIQIGKLFNIMGKIKENVTVLIIVGQEFAEVLKCSLSLIVNLFKRLAKNISWKHLSVKETVRMTWWNVLPLTLMIQVETGNYTLQLKNIPILFHHKAYKFHCSILNTDDPIDYCIS